MTLTTLGSGCAGVVASETEGAVCAELRGSLPTYSERDTDRTLVEAAEFVAVFEKVCGP